ncbi:AMSH-like ubiquitin thioesterase 3 [Papaver somniferum]|uniref:AMSH-like ubiquitin thioesterase 3 n=1 Tax=Papaver somniferum TaxID=3469 RepID=UPI000E6FDD16|nr:AMSH-like ubiquitin thioesterase 3 [Papaver somniferum]
MNSSEASWWKESTISEMDSIKENDTWELSDLPPGCKTIGCKWVFRRKRKIDGTFEKYKARLVAKVYKQKEGVDFFDAYSAVTRITSIRMLIVIAAVHKLEIHQMDIIPRSQAPHQIFLSFLLHCSSLTLTIFYLFYHQRKFKSQDGNIDVPLRDYYRTAGSLLKQANGSREEGNIIDLYITLNRFSSLVEETIPCQPDYLDTLAKKRSVYRKKLSAVMSELRSIKPDVYRRVTELNKAYYHSQSADSTNQKITSDLETSQLYPTGRSASQASSRHNNLFSRHNNSFQTVSSNNMHIGMQFPKMYVSCFTLHQDMFPTIFSTTFVYANNRFSEHFSYSHLTLKFHEFFSMFYVVLLANLPVITLLKLGQVLFLLMVLSPDHSAYLLQKRKHCPGVQFLAQMELINLQWTRFFHWMMVDGQDLQRDHVLVPANMMEGFLRLAQENTKKNLETCGVLAGKMENKVFHITTLIIPKQEATSDSCSAMNEEELFEFQDKLSIFPLGWIHIMLPEAIAIVMAPSDTYRQHGIFHLSDPGGVSLIRHCQQRGFHAHEEPSDGSPIYEHCSHVYMNPKLKFEIVDLR